MLSEELSWSMMAITDSKESLSPSSINESWQTPRESANRLLRTTSSGNGGQLWTDHVAAGCRWPLQSCRFRFRLRIRWRIRVRRPWLWNRHRHRNRSKDYLHKWNWQNWLDPNTQSLSSVCNKIGFGFIGSIGVRRLQWGLNHGYGLTLPTDMQKELNYVTMRVKWFYCWLITFKKGVNH